MRYLTYLKKLLSHKWFVFLECLKMGMPLVGLIHDWSKFLPDEFIPYARYFGVERRDEAGDYDVNSADDDAFELAWLKHQHRNPHHWQYWTAIIFQFDVVIGKWYNASDGNKGGVCGCLEKKLTRSYAQNVTLSDLERTFDTGAKSDDYVTITIEKQPANIESERMSRSGIKNTIGRGMQDRKRRNVSGRLCASLILNIEGLFWSIMGAFLQCVHVVVNQAMNFYALITFGVAGKNIERNLLVELGDLELIDGLSKITSRQFSAFSVIIVTHHMDITAIVPIIKTEMLVNDEDGVSCLQCGQVMLYNDLVALPMPVRYWKEMLCDWRGAGRAYTGADNTKEWYLRNKDKMQLHPETRLQIEMALSIFSYEKNATNNG